MVLWEEHVSVRIIYHGEFFDFRANLRTEFEGDLPYSGSMDASPKRKTSATLMAGETKTSVMRQELNSGKGVSNLFILLFYSYSFPLF